MRRIYLDHSATTPVDDRVVDSMMPFYTKEFGNPSSAHGFGRAAKVAIEHAREQIAGLINAQPSEIVFTASGSESNNMAISGLSGVASSKRAVVSSRLEHHAVLHPLEKLRRSGFNIRMVPHDTFGQIKPSAVESHIDKDTFLVSIMHANNEIGTINPIGAIGRSCLSRGVPLHVDAVQSFGKIPIDVRSMHIDLLSASAHKIYGPKGIGILYVRQGLRLDPIIVGGSQERGQRAGTENTAGIVGFGKAAEIASHQMENDRMILDSLQEQFLKELAKVFPDVQLNGHPSERLPGHMSVSIKGVAGDELMMMLDLKGMAISTGSACTSGSVVSSHVLEGLSLDVERARGTVRITFGRSSQSEDVPVIVSAMRECVEKMLAAKGQATWPQ